jgi:hypothetical protein
MDILRDVAAELLSMFVADARLTLTALGLVALVAALIWWLQAPALLAGAILLAGTLAIIFEATWRETNRRGHK